MSNKPKSHKKITANHNGRYAFITSPEVREKARAEIRANLSHGAQFAVGFCACGLRLSVADTGGVCLSCADERELLKR